ncbi:MAG: amidohydrolase, partial [Bryobacteraceae bacterium]
MQTPWGDFHVCDAHVHFFSPAFFASLAAQGGQSAPNPQEIGRILDWRVPLSCEDLAAAWIQELDEYSLAKAALIASIPGDEDSVAAAARLHPDRFWGFFMANPAAPDCVARV